MTKAGPDTDPIVASTPRGSGRRAEWVAAILTLVAPPLVKFHLISGLLLSNPLYLYSGLAVSLEPAWAHSAPTTDPNIGFTSQALGHRAALDILGGRMPWWNPYEGTGAPLAGEMQSAALFPFTLLLYFKDGQLYEHVVLQAIAGLFAYFLMRRLRCAPVASVAGALAFEFNGTFAWLANAVINPIPFLPLMLYGVETLRSADRKKHFLIGSVCVGTGLALSLYAGFPEVAYLNAILIALWFVTRLRSADFRQPSNFLIRTTLAGVSGLLISAPILIAFLDYLAHAFVGDHQANGFAGVHIAPDHLANLFLPYFSAGIFRTANQGDLSFWGGVGGYSGIALIALGVAGAVGSRDRRLRVLLAVWVMVTVASCYGLMGVNRFLSLLPGYGSAAFYRYLPASWEFALAVLAAFAIDDMLVRPSRGKNWALFAGAVVASVLLFAALHIASNGHGPADFRPIWVFASLGLALALLVAMLVLALAPLPPLYRSAAVAALLVSEAILYFLVPTFGHARHAKLDLAGVRFLQDHIGLQRFYAIGGVLQPNYGSYFGLASINHNDLPLPAEWVQFIRDKLDDNAPEVLFTGYSRRDPVGASAAENLVRNMDDYANIGVRYVVAPRGTNPFASNAAASPEAVYADPLMTIYEVRSARHYFSADGCELQVYSRERLTANCAHPTKLVRLELSMPGWHVALNGQQRALGRSDPIFQDLDLPAGRSEVEFRFAPPFILGGYIGFAAGIALLLGTVLFPIARTDRRRRE